MLRDSFPTPEEEKKKKRDPWKVGDEFTVFICRDREGLVPGSILWKLEMDVQSDAGA